MDGFEGIHKAFFDQHINDLRQTLSSALRSPAGSRSKSHLIYFENSIPKPSNARKTIFIMAMYYHQFNGYPQIVPNSKTAYAYMSVDGGPPNNGIPPPKPAGPAPPTSNPYFSVSMPPPSYPQMTQSIPFAAPPATGPPLAAPKSLQAPPLTGNKVLGITPSFPGNIPSYIFPKHNVVVHLFHENVVNKYPSRQDGSVYVPSYSNNLWTAHFVPCNMLISEFIEQIDCVKRANHYQPYPEYGIGIQELHEQEQNGVFTLGSRIMLNDHRASNTIGDLWQPGTGQAGGSKPPYLVRIPVCKY